MVGELIFGTSRTAVIDAAVDVFCRARLGAGVAETIFRASSTGVVIGVRLRDGRRVAIKAHPARESVPRLQEVQRVQEILSRRGFPCPYPLAAPAPVANGIAIAEELLDDGQPGDTHQPALRKLAAQSLARHLELTRAAGRPRALEGGWNLYTPGRLWPRQAHSPIFDLVATAAGAEWIDDIAAKARIMARPSRPETPVVGHHDWSGKHFRFAGGRVTAVYDWDSLRLGREAVVVGNAAMTYTTNPQLAGVRQAPTPEEVRAFVDDYSAARQRPLRREDRESIAACATYLAAYIARCEHALRSSGDAEGDGSFTTALRTHGERYLLP